MSEQLREPSALETTLMAQELADVYPLGEALHHLAPHTDYADNPALLLLRMHIDLGRPVEQLTSVVIATHQMDAIPQEYSFEVPSDTIIPPFQLSDGRIVRIPPRVERFLATVEVQLPDAWNSTYPHSTDELSERVQVTNHVADFLAKSYTPRIDVQGRTAVHDATAVIEPFERYAEYLRSAHHLIAEAGQRLAVGDERLHALAAGLQEDRAEDAAAVQRFSTRQAIHALAHMLVEKLGEFEALTSRPRNIPPKYLHVVGKADDEVLQAECEDAAHDIDVRTRWAKADLRRGNESMWD